MSLGPSLTNNATTPLIHSNLIVKGQTTKINNSDRYSYKTCPICSQRLLVRINGSFVYKWISTHFSTHHHEWMHVIVNLNQY